MNISFECEIIVNAKDTDSAEDLLDDILTELIREKKIVSFVIGVGEAIRRPRAKK